MCVCVCCWLYRLSLEYIAFALGRNIFQVSIWLVSKWMACSLNRQINLKRVCAYSMLNVCVIDNVLHARTTQTHTLQIVFKFSFSWNELCFLCVCCCCYTMFIILSGKNSMGIEGFLKDSIAIRNAHK